MTDVGWLFEVQASGTTYRFWSGVGQLTLIGETWLGGGRAVSQGGRPIVAIGPAEATAGVPDLRLQVTIDVETATLRTALLQDLGPARAIVYWISRSGGGSWTVHPFRVDGNLSRPQVVGTVASFEIETLAARADAQIPKFWSHEDQQRRRPGDRGLEYMAALAAREIQSDWPPQRS